METPREGDDGEPVVNIRAADNVYNYLMFTGPIEAAKSPGVITWNTIVAYGLVFLAVFCQSILLYAIYNEVVVADVDWRAGIVQPPQALAAAKDTCNPGGSLCTAAGGGNYSCAPPTVQLTGRWNELDTNGDGVWTIEEVRAAQADLKCKYAVDPVEVFNVFVKFLLSREKLIWIHPELKAGRKIFKPYFTYAAGDLIMCGYRSSKMCPNLLKRGFFDAPLKHGTAPRVGTTIDSALDYCYALLEDGGVCERTLPSTYASWKKSSEGECGAPGFQKFVYEHPVSKTTKSMLSVDYEARSSYKNAANSDLFYVYKGIVIGLFLLAMFHEFKDIQYLLMWVIKFPSTQAVENGKEVRTEEADGKTTYIVQAASAKSRIVAATIVMVRLGIMGGLTYVGAVFLLKDTDWVNLLLNGVALVFVVEIMNALYVQILNHSLQEEYEETEPMAVPAMGYRFLNERPALKDILGFLTMVSLLVTILYCNHTFVAEPMSHALECACLNEGESCTEANKFNYDFWHNYWKVEVPRIFDEVDTLRTQGWTQETSALSVQRPRDPAGAEEKGKYDEYTILAKVPLPAKDEATPKTRSVQTRWQMDQQRVKRLRSRNGVSGDQEPSDVLQMPGSL